MESHASQAHERERVEMYIAGQGEYELFSLAQGLLGPPDRDGYETDLFA
jgi:hypothetical protein